MNAVDVPSTSKAPVTDESTSSTPEVGRVSKAPLDRHLARRYAQAAMKSRVPQVRGSAWPSETEESEGDYYGSQPAERDDESDIEVRGAPASEGSSDFDEAATDSQEVPLRSQGAYAHRIPVKPSPWRQVLHTSWRVALLFTFASCLLSAASAILLGVAHTRWEPGPQYVWGRGSILAWVAFAGSGVAGWCLTWASWMLACAHPPSGWRPMTVLAGMALACALVTADLFEGLFLCSRHGTGGFPLATAWTLTVAVLAGVQLLALLLGVWGLLHGEDSLRVQYECTSSGTEYESDAADDGKHFSIGSSASHTGSIRHRESAGPYRPDVL
ncbi:hypothetical protein CDCA_CDCA17G4415 [Cyanidium caldarium]|uniref:Uncharacterized protein n=1 Tax=Cyanidium caldarium TaxID=2771 RepID=A0AAV9J226_CYACA|nr:hypothetical protein CDCA_CDCA17G4415 [Cyanidium caldarium]